MQSANGLSLEAILRLLDPDGVSGALCVAYSRRIPVTRRTGRSSVQPDSGIGVYEPTDGIVYVQPVGNVSGESLRAMIQRKVSIETTTCSDSWWSWRRLLEDCAGREMLNHVARECVRGSVSINGIEGFRGCAEERLIEHHRVSPDHIVLNLKELEHRFHHRAPEPTDVADHLVRVPVASEGP